MNLGNPQEEVEVTPVSVPDTVPEEAPAAPAEPKVPVPA